MRIIGVIDPLDARSCYPMSKRASETLCSCFAKQYSIKSVIVRPSHVYGPTARAGDSRAITEFKTAQQLVKILL